MSMDKLKTDGDVMIYLTNIQRALQKLAEQTGQIIDLRANPNGYANASIGDYGITQFKDNSMWYEYTPTGKSEDWKFIEPCQANFAGEPKEKAPGAGKQSGT